MHLVRVAHPLVIVGLFFLSQTIEGQESSSNKITVLSDSKLQQPTPPRPSASGRSQVNVTVVLRDSTVRHALQEVLRQAKLRPMYNTSSPAFEKRIQVNLVNVPALTALETILRGTGLVAKLGPDGETIMIRAANADGEAQDSVQTGIVTGRVTDSASGEGIVGVAVTVQGTKHSVVTGRDGAFTIAGVPAGEQLVHFRILGYESAMRTVQVSDRKRVSVDVVLKQTANILAGVVTTATGEQRKLEVGHTVTTLNVDSIIKVAPVMSVTDILESRVPGMTIQRTSGTPGDPARIRIRGAGSITLANDPIIVVDGIRMYSVQSSTREINVSGSGREYATPSPLDQIDINTIETIEVLKGPSASAMYGSDAANGVIIVTTKRGTSGPPRWTLSAETGMTYQPGEWPASMYKWSTPLLGGMPSVCVGFCGDAQVDSVVMFQALNNPYLTVLGRGSTFGSSAGVSGGSQTITYNFSASMGRERGILKLPDIEADRYQKFQGKPVPEWMRRPDLLTRRGGQGSVRVDFSPTLGLTVTTQFNQSVQNRTSMSSSTNTAIRELQGLWVDLSQLDVSPLLGNPYERVRNTTNTLQHSGSLRFRPVSWLPITSRVGMNTITSNAEMTIERGLLTTNESGGVLRGKTRTSSMVTGALNTIIPLMNRMDLSAGVDFNRRNTYDQSGAFFGIPEGVSDPSIGEDTARNQFSRSTSESVSFGWFLEPRLKFRSRFFVMPGFRLDNNGLSGKNAKLNGLPKMNLSWVVSEEPYFPWKDVFQMIRVRTAFGVSGVQPSGNVERLYRRRVVNPYQDSEPFYGQMLQLNSLGNTRIRPERVRELEGGIDLELLQNRLNMELTLYRTRRYDAIVRDNYAGSVDGGGTISMNVGDIDKRGTELSLQAQLIERPRVAFNMTVTFDKTDNRVLRLAGNGDSVTTPILSQSDRFQYKVGYPVEGTWMRPILGYADLDQDGWIAPSEFVIGSEALYIGTTEPKYKMAFHPRLSLFRGRINVSAAVSYVNGQLQNLADASNGPLTLLSEGGNTSFRTYMIQGPDGFDRQIAYLARDASGTLRTEIGYVQHVNITRLQSVSVSANLGQNLTRWVRARNASISLQGSNLGLWTSYLGVDPNVNSISTNTSVIRDMGQQPEPRIWQVRLSLGY